VVLSKYILIQTIRNTINFELIYNNVDARDIGYLSLGSTLVSDDDILIALKMSTCLIMINVTIFALPMSSTYITFSGLTAVILVAFGMKPALA
jgi:hypothetical protein